MERENRLTLILILCSVNAWVSRELVCDMVSMLGWDVRDKLVNNDSWGWSDVGVVIDLSVFIVIVVVVKCVAVVEVWVVLVIRTETIIAIRTISVITNVVSGISITMSLWAAVSTEVRSAEAINAGASISVSINLRGVGVIVENFDFTSEGGKRATEGGRVVICVVVILIIGRAETAENTITVVPAEVVIRAVVRIIAAVIVIVKAICAV